MTSIKPLQDAPTHSYSLSIVTVVYNDKEGLRRTYQSLKSQPTLDYQWIIIDGVSTDGTVELIMSLDHPSLDWISEEDAGIYDAMNKGAERSHGKYLLFLNAGDEILPLAFAKLHEDLISTASLTINTYATVVHGPNNSDDYFFSNPGKLESYMSVYHSSTIIPKQFFTELRGYNLAYSLASDYDLLLRARLRNFPFQAFDNALSRYHRGGASDRRLIQSRLEAIFSLWANNSPAKLSGTFISLRNLIYSIYPPRRYLPGRVYRTCQSVKRQFMLMSRRPKS